jgi:hypothetical protein
LEKEVLEGAEVGAMVKAFREGRPLPESTPLPAGSPPPMATREKPKKVEEEAPVPGLATPKPSLA